MSVLVFRRPNLAAEVTYALLDRGSACIDLRELEVNEQVWRHVACQVGVELGRPCQVEAADGIGKVSLADRPADDDERERFAAQALVDEFDAALPSVVAKTRPCAQLQRCPHCDGSGRVP